MAKKSREQAKRDIVTAEIAVAKRWPDLEGDERAEAICSLGRQLKDDQTARETRQRLNLRDFEGVELDSLGGRAYVHALGKPSYELTHPLHRSNVDTVVAQISGRQKPRPQFLTSGADWKTKRKTKKYQKFVEAGMQIEQPPYANMWEAVEECCLKDALTASGVGTLYISAGWQGDKRVPRAERVLDTELYVDPLEAETGTPRTLWWGRPWSVDELLSEFVESDWARENADEETLEKRKHAILGARDMSADANAGNPRTIKMVEVWAVWRLPRGKQKGVHVIACNGVELYSREHKRPRFPFLRYIWARARMTPWWGVSLVDEGRQMVNAINENSDRLQERVRLCSGRRTYYTVGSVPPEFLEANDPESLIPVLEGAALPTETLVPPFSEAERSWNNDLRAQMREDLGISYMQATGRKEPGVVAASAIRSTNDLGTIRLSPRAKNYEALFPQAARLWLDAVQDIAEEQGGEFEVQFRGKRFIETMKFADCKLDDELFEITVAAASQLTQDPAGRLDLATELYQLQAISLPTLRQLLLPSGTLDVESELDTESAEYEYVEYEIDRYLDADEATWRDGDFVGPEGFIVDKPRALLQFAGAYFRAKIDKAPQFNLDLLRAYIEQLDEMIQRASAATAAAAAPPAPPMATPGMPPMAGPPPGVPM